MHVQLTVPAPLNVRRIVYSIDCCPPGDELQWPAHESGSNGVRRRTVGSEACLLDQPQDEPKHGVYGCNLLQCSSFHQETRSVLVSKMMSAFCMGGVSVSLL